MISDKTSLRFKDYSDLLASGSIASGWVPYWIPREAVNIQEWHDIDTNAGCVVFWLSKEIVPDLPCSQVKLKETIATEDHKLNSARLKNLCEQGFQSQILPDKPVVYECKDIKYPYMLVDKQQLAILYAPLVY